MKIKGQPLWTTGEGCASGWIVPSHRQEVLNLWKNGRVVGDPVEFGKQNI